MSSHKHRNRARRRAEKLMDQALAAVADGAFTLAERESRRAIEIGRVNPRLWLDHARVLDACGATDEAAEAARQAIALAPNYGEAFAELARLQAARGRLEAAVRLQSRAVELCPAEPLMVERLRSYEAVAPAPAAESAAGEAPAAPPDPRVAGYEWDAVGGELREVGAARLPGLLQPEECAALIALWDDRSCFEHEVVLDEPARGDGVYRFFHRPLPAVVAGLREAVYGPLAVLANEWQVEFHRTDRFPARLPDFIERCHAAGQLRSTPILLRYPPGGFNAPHRDIAGRVVFPFQLAVTLGPGSTATDGGGELRLVDARHGRKPRERRFGTAVGDGVVFCTRERPVRIAGTVGLQPVLHGVTEVFGRERFALGIPFHEHG